MKEYSVVSNIRSSKMASQLQPSRRAITEAFGTTLSVSGRTNHAGTTICTHLMRNVDHTSAFQITLLGLPLIHRFAGQRISQNLLDASILIFCIALHMKRERNYFLHFSDRRFNSFFK